MKKFRLKRFTLDACDIKFKFDGEVYDFQFNKGETKMSQKVVTINVIEYLNDSVQNIYSFHENPEGIVEAETLFTKLAEENGFDKEEIEFGLEDGYVDDEEGYQLFLAHS